MKLYNKMVNLGAAILLIYIIYNGIKGSNFMNTSNVLPKHNQHNAQHTITINPKKPYKDYSIVEKILYNWALNDQQRKLLDNTPKHRNK